MKKDKNSKIVDQPPSDDAPAREPEILDGGGIVIAEVSESKDTAPKKGKKPPGYWKARFSIKKRKPAAYVGRAFVLLLMCFGVAVSYYCFVLPNHFAPGGIYGIGTMVDTKTGGQISFGIVTIILSIPLIIGAFIVLDFESALIIALLAIITNTMSIFMGKDFLNFPQYDAGDDKMFKVFAAIIGGGLSGATFGLTIKIFGTADGTIALASIIKKKRPDLSIAWMTYALDAVVVAASLFVFWGDYTSKLAEGASFSAKLVAATEPIMYSLINMFMVSKVCDIILKGFETAYKFEVITDKPQEISEEIFKRLDRGVTIVPAKGAYTGSDKSLLICIVKKRQIGEFQRIIKSIPGAFAYITSTSEVMGSFLK